MLFDKQLHSKNILYVANNPELPSKFRNEMFDILSNKDTMKYLSVYPDMKFLLNDIEVRHQRNISHQSANYVMLVEEGHKRPLVKGKTKFDENGFPLEVDHFTLIGVIGLPR
ncbi:hypothetical protein HK099_002757 [Clydaea vesicula]|uniref:Uncharacterized protein n=1 Tax=Clydaea vesicula TaxID=447962 RepID=A0AAD5XWK5_9FUNG|nr:hypothetical protein HK099_002757 [Clydaea vesicula]KAJ3397834.1 hypothetical protein HDU92_002506 [Lobulomyces angularis]